MKLTITEMARRYVAGDSVAKVAAQAGLRPMKTHRLLVAHGVKMRARHDHRLHRESKAGLPPARMVELYHAGHSVEKVARLAGLSATNARRILVDHGVQIRPRLLRPGTPVEHWPFLPAEMAARYRAGESAASLAALAGVKVATIREVLVALGNPLRSPLGTPKARLADLRFSPKKIAELYLEGDSVKELALALNVSGEMVRSLLLKQGVSLRGRGGQPSATPQELVERPHEMKRLYRAGHSLEAVAEATGSTVPIVRTVLLKLGVKLRGKAGSRSVEPLLKDYPPEKMAERYRSGGSMEMIARESGIGLHKIAELLRRQNVKLRDTAAAMRQPPAARKLRDATLARRYTGGETLIEIALAAGTTVAVVRRILRDRGVTLRPIEAILALTEDEIVALYRDGKSLEVIAGRAGCSNAPIRSILQRRGEKIRSVRDIAAARAAPLRLTEEELETRYVAGAALSELAAAAATDTTRVANILHRRGVKMRPRGATRQADDAGVAIPPAEMEARYAAGQTLIQIGKLAGINRARVCAILKRRGVKIRNRR